MLSFRQFKILLSGKEIMGRMNKKEIEEEKKKFNFKMSHTESL